MDSWATSAAETLAAVISGYKHSPVDLLDIGDEAGEWTYLINARQSYLRTLSDVGDLISQKVRNGERVKVLEVGAYLGAVSLTLSRLGCAVTALDLPEFMANSKLQEKYRQDKVDTVSVNLRDYVLPFDDGAFDLVIMCETLEHLNFNPLPILTEINRVLTDNGRIYLALPNLCSLVNRIKMLLGFSIHNPIIDFNMQLSRTANLIVGIHWREYTRKELFELLDITGFSVENHRYVQIPGAKAMARILYLMLPSLRPGQSVIARRSRIAESNYFFTDATHNYSASG